MENKLRNLDQEFVKYCQENDLKKVEACLSLEVDVNTVSEAGWWSGLTVAAHKNYTHAAGVRKRREHTPLMFACKAGHSAISGTRPLCTGH